MVAVQRLTAQAKLRVQRARARYGPIDVGIRTFRRYSEDDGGFSAASLTYYMFFSVFPLLLFATAALGYIAFLNDDIKEDLLNAGISTFPLLKSALKEDVLQTINQNAGGIAVLGALLGLYTGSGGVIAMSHALNKIERVQDEGSFITKRLNSLKWLGIFGLAAAVSVGLGAVSQFVGALGSLLAIITGLALSTFIFATAFKFLVNTSKSWRDILPGALVAGIAFELLKQVGGLFLEKGNAGRTATFGAFATAAGLLVASYLLAQISLLAAELNAVLAERRTTRQSSVST